MRYGLEATVRNLQCLTFLVTDSTRAEALQATVIDRLSPAGSPFGTSVVSWLFEKLTKALLPQRESCFS